MSSAADALHPIEIALLKSLSTGQPASLEMLSEKARLEMDQVRRGIEWLKFKKFVEVTDSLKTLVSLGTAGKAAFDSGLPERRLITAVKEGMTNLAEVVASGRLNKDEANAAIASAKRNGWIRLSQGTITLASETLSPEELLIQRLQQGELDSSAFNDAEHSALQLLLKRPGYIVQKELKTTRASLTPAGTLAISSLPDDTMHRALTPKMITSGTWREIKLAPLDVEAPAPRVFPGRRHPLVDIIEETKEIFVGLGFEEIDGPIVQSGFWNFDALYIPQDHSAREMQDTFYISGLTRDISATGKVKSAVARMHENGWGGKWNIAEARRAVLRTHTTPVTLRKLATSKSVAARFFSVGRVFRNEKPSYKHLVEFNQIEGVATAPGLSLRDLMGLQKEFYSRMGLKKVKFWPTFFPYTEPSLQSMVYNENLGKWVELFGMGIFRPEVTGPLGIKNPVLAWGGGIERIAMLRYRLDDVRELYSSRLSWLRGVPKCP